MVISWCLEQQLCVIWGWGVVIVIKMIQCRMFYGKIKLLLILFLNGLS